jgi:hypothetical protein
MTVAPVYVSSFLEAANHQPITSCCAAAIGHVAASIRPNLPFQGACPIGFVGGGTFKSWPCPLMKMGIH